MKSLPKFYASVRYDPYCMGQIVNLSLRTDAGKAINQQTTVSDKLLQERRDLAPEIARRHVESLLRDPQFLPTLEDMLTEALIGTITDQVYCDNRD